MKANLFNWGYDYEKLLFDVITKYLLFEGLPVII